MIQIRDLRHPGSAGPRSGDYSNGHYRSQGCSLEDIKTLCWEQLEPMTEKNLAQILAGESANGLSRTRRSTGNQGRLCAGEEVTPGGVEQGTGERGEGQ